MKPVLELNKTSITLFFCFFLQKIQSICRLLSDRLWFEAGMSNLDVKTQKLFIGVKV